LALGFAHELRNGLSGARLVLSRLTAGAEHGFADERAVAVELAELVEAARRAGAVEVADELDALVAELEADAPRRAKLLQTLEAALTRGLALTRDVLHYGRLGEAARDEGSTVLGEVVDATIAELGAAGSVVVDVAAGLEVPGSRDHVRTIVENLLRNALEAHAPGVAPRVAVHAAPTADGATKLVVRDHGAGFSDAALARATEPFFSTKPGGAGVGLGLSLVARITELYGATLALANADGGGAEVTVTWPRTR
ncbi:HAMP domain-containing histidine kinase, partial [Myxococcota bacterium]|nr:HAMP domain-containing histidine kinase [Myxococcota bacterium]